MWESSEPRGAAHRKPDLIKDALDFVCGFLCQRGTPPREASPGRQEDALRAWGRESGNLLDPHSALSGLRQGGQEHDIRLDLQNALVPGIVRIEGIVEDGAELAVATFQPALEIVAVEQDEIDSWFALKGFKKVIDSVYYREADNIAVFDAHEKNVVRVGNTLIPFDIIPWRPSPGFRSFIAESLARGAPLEAIRGTSTQSRD